MDKNTKIRRLLVGAVMRDIRIGAVAEPEAEMLLRHIVDTLGDMQSDQPEDSGSGDE